MIKTRRRCFAIEEDGERCTNQSLEGLKWCDRHNPKCFKERKKYKSDCANIAKEETICRNIKNLKELRPIEIDEYIKEYQNIIKQSDLCVQSRKNFENKCIFETERNKSHEDFKNNLRLKKNKCESIIQELVNRSKEIKKEALLRKNTEDEINEEVETNIVKKKIERTKRSPKDVIKRSRDKDTDINFEDIINKNKEEEKKYNSKLLEFDDVMMGNDKICFAISNDNLHKLYISIIDNLDNDKYEIYKTKIRTTMTKYLTVIEVYTLLQFLKESSKIIGNDKKLNNFFKKAIKVTTLMLINLMSLPEIQTKTNLYKIDMMIKKNEYNEIEKLLLDYKMNINKVISKLIEFEDYNSMDIVINEAKKIPLLYEENIKEKYDDIVNNYLSKI